MYPRIKSVSWIIAPALLLFAFCSLHASVGTPCIASSSTRMIELKVSPPILPYSFDLAGFKVLWKHFDGRKVQQSSLELSQESSVYSARTQTIKISLAQPAPTVGIIQLVYDSIAGGIQYTNGRKMESFTRVVANRSGALDDWPEECERTWVGPNFWANRLQDWRIRGGRLECVEKRKNKPLRTVHLTTRRLGSLKGAARISARTGLVEENDLQGWSGFLIGAGGEQLDWRAACLVHHFSGRGGGLLAVMDCQGRLSFRSNTSDKKRSAYPVLPARTVGPSQPPARSIWEDIQLDLEILPAENSGYDLLFSAWDYIEGEFLAGVVLEGYKEEQLVGNIALVSSPHTPESEKGGRRGPLFWFRDLRLSGGKIAEHPERSLGPVMSALYTVSGGVLKMTVQMTPLGFCDPRTVRLEYRRADAASDAPWTMGPEVPIRTPGYTAHFRIEGWDSSCDFHYRVVYDPERYKPYEGLIRKDPVNKNPIVVAGFTGQMVVGRPPDDSWGSTGYAAPEGRWTPENIWFPHQGMIDNITRQDPDILLFTGDQIYESGNPTARDVQGRMPELDYLYRWYLWCWSFGRLCRDRPAVCIPDDHDVYQGNLWGDSGRRFSLKDRWGFVHKHWDLGGYGYEPAFIRMVEHTQTWHLPDPADPTPIRQGIPSAYTGFTWGEVGFAVIEDRKYKSGIPIVNPPPGIIADAKITDTSKLDPLSTDVPGARLLGDRQLDFLRRWVADWVGTKMKLAVSPTNFAGIQTYPDGEMVPDFDSDAWPQSGRNAALEILRKGRVLALSGDQHLAVIVQHGIQKHRDAIFQFCVPAVANKYRRWFDPAEPGANREPGAPSYTGDFLDAFGNKITIYAVANSKIRQRELQRDPKDRDSGRVHSVIGRHINRDGYGIVRIDKKKQTYTLECWPWDADFQKDGTQYAGWPRVIRLEDNDGRTPYGWLPDLTFRGLSDPVVQVIDQQSGELVYATRAREGRFRPPVYADGTYTIRVGEPTADGGGMKTIENLKPEKEPGSRRLTIQF